MGSADEPMTVLYAGLKEGDLPLVVNPAMKLGRGDICHAVLPCSLYEIRHVIPRARRVVRRLDSETLYLGWPRRSRH